MSDPASTLQDLAPGEVLNAAWRLEEQIGQGGMGRVFRATDLKLNRRAAVKAVSIQNLDEETVKRFEREAQVMGKLDHPGVVTLFGVGRTRGIPWLAMRYLDGVSLWGVLDSHQGRMPPAALLPIARQLLQALTYIHGRGLLHRDLKPSNIHVSPQGKVTLLDLGLARGQKSTLTRTGVIWGTPDYMAPEQIVGEKQLDGRADLYALSVVLYRMLSGTPPFKDDDEQELLRAHLTQARPDVSRVVEALPAQLGAALQKGMAIRPDDRFQSAAEMLTTLEWALSPTADEPPTTPRVQVVTETVSLRPQVTTLPAAQPERLTLMDDDDEQPAKRTDQMPELARVLGMRDENLAVPAQKAPSKPRPSAPRPPPVAAADEKTPVPRTAPMVAAVSREPAEEPSGASITESERTTAPTGAPLALHPAVLVVGAIVLLALGVLLGKLL